jgi:S-adenosylmethionine hydrolase
VDPQVGTERRAIALRAADGRLLVGPDNGLLSLAWERCGGIELAVDVSRSPHRLEPVSATFHGRDIFAPVAAHLALGEQPDAEIDAATLVRLERPVASEGAATVLEVDGFGNLRLDAPADIRAARVEGRDVVRARTFGDVAPGALLLYADSDGNLALAVNGGSAAALLGVRAGDEVRLDAR